MPRKGSRGRGRNRRTGVAGGDRLAGMTRRYVEAPATHFRLKPETWALIAEEYKNGATAKDLGAKWKVSPTSIYRYACRDGWTKKGMGDARARAHARMVEEEEASVRAMQPVGARALKGLFSPEVADQPEAADPAHLARVATLASGRAMTGRLWAEAKALAGLAESYARLGDKAGKAAVTLETVPLDILIAVSVGPVEAWIGRLSLIGVPEDHPDRPLMQSFWERRGQVHARADAAIREQYWEGRRHGAERAAREAAERGQA